MTSLSGRLVFVPIFGPTNYPAVPEGHARLWGLRDPDDRLVIYALHYDGPDGFSATGYYGLGTPFNIFESEDHYSREVNEHDTTVPPIVLQRMAELALTGEVSHD